MRWRILVTLALAAICTVEGHQADKCFKGLRKPHRQLLYVDSVSVECLFDPIARYSKDYRLLDIDRGIKCINAVKVKYEPAVATVASLYNVFQEYYVFVDIARDPPNSTYSSSYRFPIFPEKADLLGGLRKLAESFPVNQSVGVADVQLPINDLFNKLRDTHVIYVGQGKDGTPGTVFGDVLDEFTLALWDEQEGDLISRFEVWAADNHQSSGKVYLAQGTELLVQSVDSKPLVRWITEVIAADSLFPIPYKSLGARVNNILSSGPMYLLKSVGNITRLANATYNMQSNSPVLHTWKWVLLNTKGSNFMNSLPELEQEANQPGDPYLALVKGVEVYENITSMRPERTEEANVRRRSTVSLPSPLTEDVYPICCGDDRGWFGEYSVQPGYAVMKLRSFSFDLIPYHKAWSDLVKKSKAAGVTNLIFDLIGNGGGNVDAGYYGATCLYPSIKSNTYNRIVGPAARYLVSSGLDITTLNTTRIRLKTNTTYLEERVSAINANKTELDELIKDTTATLEFIDTLFRESPMQQSMDSCKHGMDCRELWELLEETRRDLRAAVQGTYNLGIDTIKLATIMGDVVGLLDVINPYTVFDQKDDYLEYGFQLRGGMNNSYTRRYTLHEEGFLPFGEIMFPKWVAPPTHPFKKIIALTDGLCGSTCDTFSRTSWFYSLAHPEAPTFRFASYGGTGKRKDISATSFPGGNVNEEDYMSQSWAYYMLAYTLAAWTGNQTLMQLADSFGEKLPIYPYGLGKFTPIYTQSQIYQREMGPDALPMEYYVIPTDYYIEQWHRHTRTTDSPISSLPTLYRETYKFFEQMPEPKKQKFQNRRYRLLH